jgi:cytidine deaminase
MSTALPSMLEAARHALAHAHAPYSRFRVGACVRTASGRLYAGCNVENASYGLTLCAETTAIGAMIEVLVLTDRAEHCPPCGRCRQQLAEFARPGTPVHLCGPEGLRLTTTLGELLPLAFGPGAFERPEP